MTRAVLPRARSALTHPFAVPAGRAVLEGATGCILLAMIGVLICGTGQIGAQSYLPGVLGWLWLLCWPAWRMSPVRSRTRLRRVVKGLVRLVVLAIILGLIWAAISAAFWSLRWQPSPFSATGPMVFGFIFLRLVLVPLVALGRRIRRRLRWQLMASHLAVIFLTFITLTAIGSTLAAGLLVKVMTVSAPDIASAVAHTVEVLPSVKKTGRIDAAQARSDLALLQSAQLSLDSGGPFNFTALSRSIVQVVVLDASRSHQVLASYIAPICSEGGGRSAAFVPPDIQRKLVDAALAGGIASEPAPSSICPRVSTLPQQFGAAGIRTTDGGRTLGVVVVQTVPRAVVTPAEVFGMTVAIFGATTLILFVLWTLPSLALSGVFGYVLARGLTRRLEAVSRVTTAIARGDLSQRAPVDAQNEIGLLAGSVNGMAEHLQHTISELEQARQRAEQSLRHRRELVANISHELRTPLAVVQAHLDAMTADTAVPVGAASRWESDVTVSMDTIQALQREMDRLAALVEDLFALSRAETGALQVRREAVDVASMVGEVASLMRPLAQREGMITLVVEAPPGLPRAMADPDRLRQIISNLVRNAVRHTPDGGIIVMSVAREDPWVVVSVADTGEGIAPEHLPHIFERFYRVDQARTRSSGGAGLGLAIVREFVELMGGKVTVESTVGEGSCFRVYLPSAT